MGKDIEYLLRLEENLIYEEINSVYDNLDDLSNINSELLLTNSNNIAFRIHNNLVNALISKSLAENFKISKEKINLIINDISSLDIQIDTININEVLELFHTEFLNSQFEYDIFSVYRKRTKHHSKEIGAVYTSLDITHNIVSTTLKNFSSQNGIQNLKCLDFACGTGRFYMQALEILKNEYNLDYKTSVVKHLFAVDIDSVAIKILKYKILMYIELFDDEIISGLSSNILNRNVLIQNNSLFNDFNISIDFKEDFKGILLNEKFDVIFSNPPYFLLKVNKSKDKLLEKYSNFLSDKISQEINYFKNSGIYNFSLEGMLNYYKLSIESICNFLNEKGELGIICPSSIFGDLSSSKLRKYLLLQNKVRSIEFFPESAKLFDNVSQSTVIFYLQKNGKTDILHIKDSFEDFKINFEIIKKVFDKNLEVPLIDKLGWDILNKLSNFNKIKDFSYLRNKRGELDLTLYKDCITNEDTGYRLIRGNMIGENAILMKQDEFVKVEEFTNRKSKDYIEYDFNKPRLICQQISNIDLKKRLKFVFSESSYIIANSCNYINSNRSFKDLEKLSFILNSSLLNWRFKITSSNNHINNYEIDEFPILDLDKIDLNKFGNNKIENDKLICELYGLNEKEIEYILNA